MTELKMNRTQEELEAIADNFFLNNFTEKDTGSDIMSVLIHMINVYATDIQYDESIDMNGEDIFNYIINNLQIYEVDKKAMEKLLKKG